MIENSAAANYELKETKLNVSIYNENSGMRTRFYQDFVLYRKDLLSLNAQLVLLSCWHQVDTQVEQKNIFRSTVNNYPYFS